jgi:dUTP pyrophosphatase
MNSPGTIDEDYRGMLGVIMINHGPDSFKVTPGMRVAQLVIQPVVQGVSMVEVEEFDETERGEGGFGSTGQ